MAEIRVYGSSDDLIEVEGTLTEEFNTHEEYNYLAFSTGTLLQVEYTQQSIWRIRLLDPGSCTVVIHQATLGDDSTYSDLATIITDEIDAPFWCVRGDDFAGRTPDPSRPRATILATSEGNV